MGSGTADQSRNPGHAFQSHKGRLLPGKGDSSKESGEERCPAVLLSNDLSFPADRSLPHIPRPIGNVVMLGMIRRWMAHSPLLQVSFPESSLNNPFSSVSFRSRSASGREILRQGFRGTYYTSMGALVKQIQPASKLTPLKPPTIFLLVSSPSFQPKESMGQRSSFRSGPLWVSF
jgi:hypothetical protein